MEASSSNTEKTCAKRSVLKCFQRDILEIKNLEIKKPAKFAGFFIINEDCVP